MHRETSGEVEHPSLGKPAAAPDPMGNRNLDEEEPEECEQEYGAEAHALDEGANNERRRNDGEGHLEQKNTVSGSLIRPHCPKMRLR